MHRLPVVLTIAFLVFAAPASAEPTDTAGCLKFNPETLLPYYDANCGIVTQDPAPVPDRPGGKELP